MKNILKNESNIGKDNNKFLEVISDFKNKFLNTLILEKENEDEILKEELEKIIFNEKYNTFNRIEFLLNAYKNRDDKNKSLKQVFDELDFKETLDIKNGTNCIGFSLELQKRLKEKGINSHLIKYNSLETKKIHAGLAINNSTFFEKSFKILDPFVALEPIFFQEFNLNKIGNEDDSGQNKDYSDYNLYEDENGHFGTIKFKFEKKLENFKFYPEKKWLNYNQEIKDIIKNSRFVNIKMFTKDDLNYLFSLNLSPKEDEKDIKIEISKYPKISEKKSFDLYELDEMGKDKDFITISKKFGYNTKEFIERIKYVLENREKLNREILNKNAE